MGSIMQLFRYADWQDKVLVLVGTIGSNVDGMIQPLTMLVLGSTINSYGSAGSSLSSESPDKHALQLLFVALVIGVAAFLEGFCWTRTAERQTSRMRRKYLEAVLRQEVSFLDTSSSTTTATYQVISTISSDSDTIQGTLGEKIPYMLANLTAFFGCLLVAFRFSWKLTLAALPFSLLIIVPGVIYGKLLMNVSIQMRETYGVAGGIAEQAISSIRTVVSYVGEVQTMKRFSEALEKSTMLGIKQGFMKGVVVGSTGMIYALWAFQAWVGSVLVIDTGAEGGHVFVAGILVILGGLSIMGALPNIRYLSDALTATSRITEMTDKLPSLKSNYGLGTTIQETRGEIEFKNVIFTYPSRPDSLVLCGLNLQIPAGHTVGLVGGSGSGKSTIISLLQRFYSPDKGEILFDGRDIKSLQIKWFRSQMGLVSQEPILFATSIRENILFGNEEASMDLIVSASKAANAHDFISKLPDGYDTHVGHFGYQISGGQKQRIAIARALIRNPKVLLLDEATSALDAHSGKLVQDALDQASVGRTTIIVAHRLATLRRANSIAVLQKGEVVEYGSHEHLTQTKEGDGVYSRMVQLQKSGVRRETTLRSPVGSTCPSPTRSSICSSGELSLSLHSQIDQKDANLKHSNTSQWRLIKMNQPEWRRGLMGCICAISLGVVQNTYSYCLGSMLSVYFLPDNHLIRSNTRKYCIIFIVLAIANIVANILQQYNFAVMGERLTRRVREKMLEKVLSFEIGWSDQDENSSASICAKLASDANKVRSLVGDRLSLLLQTFTTASLAFALALVVTWRLSIVMISAQPLIIGSFYLRKVTMTSMSKKAKKAQAEGSQLACEAVVNHRTITTFSSQKRMMDLFEKALEGPRSENIKQSWLSGLSLFSSQFIITAGTALAFWYGGKLISEGSVTSTQVFRVFFVLMSTGKLIADTGSMTSDLAQGGDAVKSVLEILDRRTRIEPDDPKGIKGKQVIKGNIEVKNVTFSYPSRPEQIIFQGMSLKIEAGKSLALVGQSGSGKSTVIGLIERFYDPQEGSVEIDGKSIKEYNLRFIRSQIALVSQEPTLFAGTIRFNIAYGSESATEAEIVQAATLANAHEFISSMGDGYETYCGERGVQLSGGQKQRIALARAILKNPSILLLDEATSALDSVSENLVQEALEKMMKGRTSVVVAHRLSTVQKSDTIALIKNGKVREQGSHLELIGKHGGLYNELIRLQGDNSPYIEH